jgi:hypothetical protein
MSDKLQFVVVAEAITLRQNTNVCTAFVCYRVLKLLHGPLLATSDKLKFIGHLFHVRDANHRLVQHRDFRGVTHVTASHCDRLG